MSYVVQKQTIGVIHSWDGMHAMSSIPQEFLQSGREVDNTMMIQEVEFDRPSERSPE